MSKEVDEKKLKEELEEIETRSELTAQIFANRGIVVTKDWLKISTDMLRTIKRENTVTEVLKVLVDLISALSINKRD